MQGARVRVLTGTAAGGIVALIRKFELSRTKLVACVFYSSHLDLFRWYHQLAPTRRDHRRLPFPFLPHLLQYPHHDHFPRYLMDTTRNLLAGGLPEGFFEYQARADSAADCAIAAEAVGNIFDSSRTPFDVLRGFRTTTRLVL